jgi:hypothetical protein
MTRVLIFHSLASTKPGVVNPDWMLIEMNASVEESGAAARALQDLADFAWTPEFAPRLGVRALLRRFCSVFIAPSFRCFN